MARPFRLHVLACDTPVPPVFAKRGTYGDIIGDLFKRGLEQYKTTASAQTADISLEVTQSNVVEMGELPDPVTVDALVLSGSKHNSYDNDEWIVRLVDYTKKVYETSQVPIIGICFGHQILGRALGGRVHVSPQGWEVAVCDVFLNARGAAIYGTQAMSLHQMHRDAVLEVPPGVENIGSSPDCALQALYVPRRVLSLQSHPEFDGFIMNNLLDMRHEQKIFNDELFGSGKRRADIHHDGVLVAAAWWKFLLEEEF